MNGKKEPVRMITLIDKIYDGGREEKVTSVSEQTGKEQSISRDTQLKGVNSAEACCDNEIWPDKWEADTDIGLLTWR